ncbi:MAG: hypothetical protein J5720_07190 [Bacteroidaceae bacterium]|nr:hypothetical protein [Bacteroidaceae bacterium]
MKEEHLEQILKQDANLREAVKRNAMQTPPVPEALNTQLMEQLQAAPHHKRHVWPWVAAACFAGIAALLIAVVSQNKSSTDTIGPQLVQVKETPIIKEKVMPEINSEEKEPAQIKEAKNNRPSPRKAGRTDGGVKDNHVESVEVASVIEEPIITEPVKAEPIIPLIPKEPRHTINDPHALTPENMDRMIAQMAAYYKVQGLELNCSNNDDFMNGTMYVLPDDEDIDIIGRLYATLLRFDTSAPNIQLMCSSEQFYFCLTSERNGKKTEDYWMAERSRGRIYLYRTQSTDDEPVSSACFFEYVAKHDRKHSNYS